MSTTQRLYDAHAAGDPAHTGDNRADGCPTCYDPIEHYRDHGWDLDAAASRGWDREAHFAALLTDDADAISLTHPANWLTETEVEAWA